MAPAGSSASAHTRAEVSRELTRFGRELARSGAAQVGDSFCGLPEADELLRERPEAFVIGVLFTQGIPAERAWQGPWQLRERLGHLDLRRLASEPDAVREAFARPPMLHRFKETLPRWVTSAARRILDEYGGDASGIWAVGSSAADVSERLSAFEGIGRKKAAMAVQILIRHLDVPLAGAELATVAYDVQVRRVFLRSGLADSDTPEAIEAAAAAACPDAPGSLDLAAWLIGRQTCRPRSPLCDRCRLGEVCPRRVTLSVKGVEGARGKAADRHSTERKSSPDSSLG